MAFNMAKAALEAMARTAALELANHQVRVNVIQPGWIDTPGERKYATEEALTCAARRIPLGRLAHLEEIAQSIMFLCDPRNEYTTGATSWWTVASVFPGGRTMEKRQKWTDCSPSDSST